MKQMKNANMKNISKTHSINDVNDVNMEQMKNANMKNISKTHSINDVNDVNDDELYTNQDHKDDLTYMFGAGKTEETKIAFEKQKPKQEQVVTKQVNQKAKEEEKIDQTQPINSQTEFTNKVDTYSYKECVTALDKIQATEYMYKDDYINKLTEKDVLDTQNTMEKKIAKNYKASFEKIMKSNIEKPCGLNNVYQLYTLIPQLKEYLEYLKDKKKGRDNHTKINETLDQLGCTKIKKNLRIWKNSKQTAIASAYLKIIEKVLLVNAKRLALSSDALFPYYKISAADANDTLPSIIGADYLTKLQTKNANDGQSLKLSMIKLINYDFLTQNKAIYLICKRQNMFKELVQQRTNLESIKKQLAFNSKLAQPIDHYINNINNQLGYDKTDNGSINSIEDIALQVLDNIPMSLTTIIVDKEKKIIANMLSNLLSNFQFYFDPINFQGSYIAWIEKCIPEEEKEDTQLHLLRVFYAFYYILIQGKQLSINTEELIDIRNCIEDIRKYQIEQATQIEQAKKEVWDKYVDDNWNQTM